MTGVVIVGGSVGGLTAARELRAQGYGGELTIIDADPMAPYRRPTLSKGFLDGTVTDARLALPWPGEMDIVRVQPARADRVDFEARVVEVHGDSGPDVVPFDTLIVATGSLARPLEVPGARHYSRTLRGLQDAITMRTALAQAHDVVIVGAGFLGLEIASVGREHGRSVTVLEAADRPLERVAGSDVGSFVAALHDRHGVQIRCRTQVAEVASDGDSCRVRCTDGTEVSADLLVAAVGSLIDTSWLRGSGADVGAGVSCDGHGRIMDEQGAVIPGAYAIGDVAAWWNPLYERRMRVEHWTNAIEQGRHVAGVIVGRDQPEFASAPYFWSEQYDARIHSIGSTLEFDEVRVLQRDEEHLLVAYGRSGSLVCVTGINVPAVLQQYRPMVEARTPMHDVHG